MTHIIGLPDGGAGIVFPDHPAHHNPADGTIQVTWSAATLREMVKAAKAALERGDLVAVERPDDEDEA